MQKSKLYESLSVLKKSDWKTFFHWTKKNIGQNEEDLMRFVHILYSKPEVLEEQNWKKEALYAKLYPGQPYDDGRMRKLMHRLLQTFEDFLARQSFEPSAYRFHFLIEAYNRPQTLTLMAEKITEFEAYIGQLPLQNGFYYQQLAKLAEYRNLYHVQQKSHNTAVDIAAEIWYEQIAGVASQLKKYFYHEIRNTIKQQHPTHTPVESLLQWVENNPQLLEIPLISLYYQALSMQLSETEQAIRHFEQLRASFGLTAGCMDKTEQTTLAVGMRNFAHKCVKQGLEAFEELRFDLFLEHIRMGLILVNNYIPTTTFLSIVSLGHRLERYAQVEAFMETHKHLLAPDKESALTTFAHALTAFGQGNFNLCLKLLTQIGTERETIRILQHKKISLQCLYHLGEKEAVITQLGTLKVYVSRHTELSPESRESELEFANLLLRLCEHGESQAARAELAKEIKASKAILKRWLLRVCESGI